MSTTNFWKNSFTKFHILGILLGMIIVFVYWYHQGQYQESIFKNNVVIALFLGGAIGYITIDLVLSSIKRGKNNN